MPIVPTVLTEITIEREDARITVKFRKAHERRISQRHRHVGVAMKQGFQRSDFRFHVKGNLQNAALHSLQNHYRTTGATLEKKASFG